MFNQLINYYIIIRVETMTIPNNKIRKNNILIELIDNQRKDCNLAVRLRLSDLKRIVKYIDTSIFDTKRCCIWRGSIINNKKRNSIYINFYFHRRKISLHRLLFANYIDGLKKNEYIKYNCNNKGRCCNINHMIRPNKKTHIFIKLKKKYNNNKIYFD